MESLLSVWTKLDARRKIIVLGASIAVFVAVLTMSRSAANRDMALLYSGLEGSAAGEVVTALDQRSISYEVRGSSIFVPSIERDTLRMTLASEGLPANDVQGYELLDNLSGFGTTSQMFDAAYWRAKEGELARTMLASPYIRAARVHISAQNSQPFHRDQKPTAAVTVTTSRGTLDANQADALRYLVASSVPGLAATDVAVIDGSGGLISGGDSPGAGPSANERAAALKSRVERILAARVGLGNSVVEVSLDTVTETESIIERRIDPDSRTAISTEVQESTTKSEDSQGTDVTIASNLPAGAAAGNGGNSTNQNSENRAITNYEISETQREIVRAPGAIRRLSVAVLVNAAETTNDAGDTIVAPRTEEELNDLRQLVASAVGFDEQRGDEITIRSMAFEPLVAAGTAAGEADIPAVPLDMMRLIQTGALALVALILGLFVVRPILAGNKDSAPALDRSLPAPLDNGEVLDGTGGGENATLVGAPQSKTASGSAVAQDVDPVDRLRNLIEERRDEAVQVLQSWIDEPSKDGGTA